MGSYEIGTKKSTRVDAELQNTQFHNNPPQTQPNPKPTKTKWNKSKRQKETNPQGAKKQKEGNLKLTKKKENPQKPGSLMSMEASITFSASSSSYRLVCGPKAQAKGGRDQKNRQASDLLTHRKKKKKIFANDDNGDDYDANLLRKKSKRDVAGKDFPRAREREKERRERELGYCKDETKRGKYINYCSNWGKTVWLKGCVLG
jgi:hypothetical protein